ncbi:MAG TPA: hypothetical protein VGR57_06435 [Ktedonobacterales bacterium]|nr:hypothetical protein [Ktedonobacterales bacterium]
MSNREQRFTIYAALTLAFGVMVPVLAIAGRDYFTEHQLESQIPAAIVLFGIGLIGVITCIPRQVGRLAMYYDLFVGLTFFVGLLSFFIILMRFPVSLFGFTQAYAAVYFFVGILLGWRGLRSLIKTLPAKDEPGE